MLVFYRIRILDDLFLMQFPDVIVVISDDILYTND